MDFSQFPGRKNRQNAGRAPDKALGTKLMFCYVKCVWKKITFFKIFKFPATGGARTSQRHRDRNTEAGSRHRPEEMAGDAAGDT
ncbi:unnamed protein product, partial [Staurois parvus]